MPPDNQKYTGSCHCGFIKYSVNIPDDVLATRKALRCNCTFCQKPGFTSLFIPEDSFHLITPSSKSDLADYQTKNNPKIHRYFCATCGVHVIRQGVYEVEGKSFEFFTLNLVTLDTPQDGIDLSQWTYDYMDGRHDTTGAHGKSETPWKDGVI